MYWNRKHPSIDSIQPSGHTPGGTGVVVVVVSHLGVVVVVSHLGVVVVVSHLGVVVVVVVVPILHPQSVSQLEIQSFCSGHQRVPSSPHVISKFP